jgi:hypothetical protein
MDCLTFRRQLLEDPSREDAVLASHEASCAPCAVFARSLRADEAKLHDLLNIDPPSELAERIQLAVSFGPEPARTSPSRWLAIAASGLLVVSAATLGWLNFHKPYEELSLERSVLHHVADETRHLYDPGPADDDKLHDVFARFGASVRKEDLGQVSFAGICMMRRDKGVHLVLRGEHGPVTVFFMPGEQASKPMELGSERFAGIIEPTTWGSIAVVGEQGEKLAPVLARVRQAVSWPSTQISQVVDLRGVEPRV